MLIGGQRVIVAQHYRIPEDRGRPFIVVEITPSGSVWATPDQLYEHRKRVHRDGHYFYETVMESPCWAILFGPEDFET